MIYNPVPVEHHELVMLESDGAYDLVRDLALREADDPWTPLRARLVVREDQSLRPRLWADAPWLGDHVLVLRDDAIDKIGSLFRPFGELLPLDCDSASLVIVSVTNLLDVLDESQSRLSRFPSGQIISIGRHAFKPRSIPSGAAFKLTQDVRGPMYLTEELVQSVDRVGLVGVNWRMAGDVEV